MKTAPENSNVSWLTKVIYGTGDWGMATFNTLRLFKFNIGNIPKVYIISNLQSANILKASKFTFRADAYVCSVRLKGASINSEVFSS